MNQDSIRQIVNDNHGLIAGSVENQIKEQMNISINFKEKSFDKTLFIDTKKLFLWEKSNKFLGISEYIDGISCDNLDEMKSLIEEIMDLKLFYVENKNVSIHIETDKLKNLKKLYNIEKDLQEKSLMIEVISDEVIICDKIKILLNLVMYDLLFLDKRSGMYTFLQILSSICKTGIEPSCSSSKILNLTPSIWNFCSKMESASEISKRQIMENINQKIEYFRIWATFPFEYVVEFQGGVKVTFFNIFFKDEQEFSNKDFNMNKEFFSVDSPINILRELYLKLINIFYYCYCDDKEYDNVFDIYRIKKISIKYSKLQTKLREIIKPFYNTDFNTQRFNNILELDQIEAMFKEYFKAEYPLGESNVCDTQTSHQKRYTSIHPF